MNIRLSSHSEEILKQEMASGRFHSAGEVVDYALESFHKAGPRAVSDSLPRPSLEQFRRFLDALAAGSDKISALPTSAFSRENIYQDHP